MIDLCRHSLPASILLAGGCLLSCSACSESARNSASLDPSAESGTDASSDVEQDGASVADSPQDSANDAIPDAEASTVEETWVESPYAAFSKCPIQQLANPESVAPYPWLPCEGMPTGCKMLDTSSIAEPDGRSLTFVARVGLSDKPRFAVIRRLSDAVESPTLFRYDGSIEAAWSYDLGVPCNVRIAWIGDVEIALAVAPAEAAMQAENVAHRIAVGTPAAILAGTAEQHDLSFDAFNLNAIEQLSVSDTTVVADGQPGGRLFVADRPAGTFEEVPQPGALWTEHVLLGSELIASAYEGRGNLYIRHADGSVEAYRADPARGEIGPGGTNEVLAWQEGVNGTLVSGYERVEIWSAPFTADPSTLAPQKLMELPNSSTLPVRHGEGWYVAWLEPLGADTNSPVRLVQLSTGKYVDLHPPTGHAFTELVGVAGGEAWFLLRAFPGSKYPVTIARIDLQGLEGMLQ